MMKNKRERTAYCDESVRKYRGRPAYFLGAILVTDEEAASIKNDLLRFHPSTKTKLHWYQLNDKLRRKIAKVMAPYIHRNYVLGITAENIHKSERARRKLMLPFLGAISSMLNCHKFIFESRTQTQDNGDLQLVKALKSSGQLDNRNMIEHQKPTDEVMLWAADIMTGIACECWAEKSLKYVDIISPGEINSFFLDDE